MTEQQKKQIDPKAVKERMVDRKAVDEAIGQTPWLENHPNWKILAEKLNALAKQHATQAKQGNEPSPEEVNRWSAAYNMEMRKSVGVLPRSIINGIFSASLDSIRTHGITCSGPKNVNFESISNTLGANKVTCKKKSPETGL